MCQNLEWDIDLLTNEVDNWKTSADCARGKLRTSEERLESLQFDYENEKLSHWSTLANLVSVNSREENLRNENDWIKDVLVQEQREHSLARAELNLFKLWFPNQNSQTIAQSFSQLDNKLQSVKKEAKRWKKAYQQEKQSHQQIKQQSKTEKNNKETIIIQILNNKLKLNLENPTLEQIISKIQELIGKPPITLTYENNQKELAEAKEKVAKLEKELQEKTIEKPINIPTNTPFGESLEKIIEIDLRGLEKELGIKLSKKVSEQIQKATNYQELSSIRNQEIKSYLEKNAGAVISQPKKELIKPFEQERWFWIILIMVSLLTIGGLLIKIKKIRKGREEQT